MVSVRVSQNSLLFITPTFTHTDIFISWFDISLPWKSLKLHEICINNLMNTQTFMYAYEISSFLVEYLSSLDY